MQRDGVWKNRLNRLLYLIAVIVMPSLSFATGHLVNVGGSDIVFSPQTLMINEGDTVTFVNKGGLHNVVADDGSFRCARGCDGDGHGGSGKASSASWNVTISFPTQGNIGYYCEIHGQPGGGMFGTIQVSASVPVRLQSFTVD